MKKETEKVQSFLNELGLKDRVIELPQSAHTAQEAAASLSCQISQIAKSILFKADQDQPILVIASGSNRIDEKKIGDLVGRLVTKADADFVLAKTGFTIGGVPPAGHLEKLQTFIDEDLSKHLEIWAAAGTSRTVFRLTYPELLEITQGRVIMVK